MKRKYVLIALCVLGLGTAVFGFARSFDLKQPQPAAEPQAKRSFEVSKEKSSLVVNSRDQQGQGNAPAGQQTGEIPEPVVYDELFFNVNFLKDKADETDRQGKDSSGLRGIYKRSQAQSP